MSKVMSNGNGRIKFPINEPAGLLTILILLGITIAIWQMVKIFDLAQVNKDTSQVANDGDNKVQGYLMLAFLGFIYGITIVSFALWGDLPLTSNSASCQIIQNK